jgi:FkbM family methyltransferase
MPTSLASRIQSKPQYVLHPGRAARRVLHRFSDADDLRREVTTLPWGLELEVQRSDQIGYSIVTGAIFDPPVTEALYRLVTPGATVYDVGANIGYLTSLVAHRAGPAGVVRAFEPHPVVHGLLAANVSRWSSRPVAPVQIRPVALSSHPGTGRLAVDATFDQNMGLASLEARGDDWVEVEMSTLDLEIGSDRVDVMKIDVEGHEGAVLAGAGALLSDRRVAHVIFEDHDPYPSSVTRIFEDAGYELYALEADLAGIRLVSPVHRGQLSAWPGPSYLATTQLDQVTALMRPRWWRTPGILPDVVRRLLPAP